MPVKKSQPENSSAKAAWRLMGVKRHPGQERGIHRIQGFVAGALFITLFQLAVDIFWSDQHVAREIMLAWATALLAALAYAWIVSLVDRNEKEPWQLLVVGFLWGTVVSYLPAALMNDFAAETFDFPLYLVAPFTEEISKGAVLFLIFYYAADEFDGPLDGILYGAIVGIGFALRENVWYFVQGEHFSTITDLMGKYQFFLRVVLQGLAGHATYTAFTGLGLGLTRETKKRWLKLLFPTFGIALAILSHLLWNTVAEHRLDPTTPEPWSLPPVIYVLSVNGLFLLIMAVAVTLSWRKEAGVIEKVLLPTLDPESPYTTPKMMRTAFGRLKARWRILRREGISAWWGLRKHQRTLIEQAFELSKAGGDEGISPGTLTDSQLKDVNEAVENVNGNPES
jgi:RsiW-degrading membrane proteinase PrsW (M82 family)